MLTYTFLPDQLMTLECEEFEQSVGTIKNTKKPTFAHYSLLSFANKVHLTSVQAVLLS